MGSKQKYNDYLRMLQQAIQQANQPSPWEQQIGAEANQIGTFLNSRDYRNLPSGVNIDMLPLAEMQRMRKMVRGAGDTGQGARGSNMSHILNAQRELDDNSFAQDWGAAYEQKVGGLMDRKDNLLGGLMGTANQRSQNNVSNYGALLQGYANKPKSIWANLLPGIISGGAGIASAAIRAGGF